MMTWLAQDMCVLSTIYFSYHGSFVPRINYIIRDAFVLIMAIYWPPRNTNDFLFEYKITLDKVLPGICFGEKNVNFLLGFTIIIVNVTIVLGSLFKSGRIFCGSSSDKVIRKVGPGANTRTFYNHHPPTYTLHMNTICHLFVHPCYIRPLSF